MKVYRAKGYTTSIILIKLGKAVMHPGNRCILYDHGFCKTKRGTNRLRGLVLYYIKILKLKEMEVTVENYNVIIVSNWKGVEVEFKNRDLPIKHFQKHTPGLTKICEEDGCETIIDKNQTNCRMHKANYIFPEGELIQDEY